MKTGTRAASGPRAKIADRLFVDLRDAPREVRRDVLAGMSQEDIAEVLAASLRDAGTPFALWADDPVGFTEDVLGETLWSKQKDMLDALTSHRRVAVPAGFGVGKTWIGARAVAWFCATQPVGVGLAVTIATRMRQVQRQLWPHVRRVHARAQLPGRCDMTQWLMPDRHDVDTVVAYGFTVPDHDEAAMQGIHAASLLLVVDEAGGIGQVVGRSTRNLLTGDARMLAIGNPATDDENTWFESLCLSGSDPDRPADTTIRIRALDSPHITGEDAGRCRDCPPSAVPHPLAQHLVDADWVADAVRENGEDAPYVIAKVHAKFPKGGSNRAIPSSWVETAADQPEPEGEEGEYVRLCDLGVEEEAREWLVRRGAWVRLGVDVAADGGDEFAIARSVGDLVTVEHVAAGADNENAVTVAGVVLRHILRAQQLATALGSTRPVRVKVDGIGVGWGVQSTLRAWGSEGIHDSHIEPVIVSEKPKREPDAVTLRPLNQRAEMYLATRSLLTPGPGGLPGRLRLGALDDRTRMQLSVPKLLTNSAGFSYIEPKKDIRGRGLRSPDRAEAVLLSQYEPAPPRRKGRAYLV